MALREIVARLAGSIPPAGIAAIFGGFVVASLLAAKNAGAVVTLWRLFVSVLILVAGAALLVVALVLFALISGACCGI